MAALGRGEQLAIRVELILHDRSHLPNALNPNDGQHRRREDAHAAADQKHQLSAYAQIVKEFAHALVVSCGDLREGRRTEERARLA